MFESPARGDQATHPVGVGWASPASYWSPPLVVASGWLEHAPFAYWLMDAVRPTTLVELGTHNGFSFFVFCEAVRRLGIDTTCSAIDTWEGDDHAGFYSEEVYRAVLDTKTTRYEETAVLLRGYFDDHVSTFDDGSIDVLHIDGRHGYEDIKHDYESWLPKVKPDGIVLFHDTAVLDRGFGVHRFWAELTARHESFSFAHGNGLGVLCPGLVHPALAGLLSASPDEAVTIREFYARRGELVTQTYARDSERDLAGQYSRELADLRASTSWRVTAPLRALGGILRGRTR